MKLPSEIAWSHSALEQFRKCPLAYYHERVVKDRKPDPNNPAFAKGNRVHEAMECRVKDNEALPSDMADWEPVVAPVCELANKMEQMHVEEELALDVSGKRTSWFGKRAWLRVKADVLAVHGSRGLVVDWKTGKFWGKTQQGALNAVATMLCYPNVQQVDVLFVYLEQKSVKPETFHRSDGLDAMMKPSLDTLYEIAHCYDTGDWQAKPNFTCKNCPVVECANHG